MTGLEHGASWGDMCQGNRAKELSQRSGVHVLDKLLRVQELRYVSTTANKPTGTLKRLDYVFGVTDINPSWSLLSFKYLLTS